MYDGSRCDSCNGRGEIFYNDEDEDTEGDEYGGQQERKEIE